ncbi:AAEL008044-PA [Aedes aegypti]|uniref:Large ribosomal subunit protein bL34m n=2 Tax=Aedes aegypti TaxID=7159 RepID=A0A1S4FIC2_AEDAE|nr:39S ribosomal protein L34, mitochondrial [Aedes aegypti]EAT40207.1 AAEL008044-PA [Aedes aegypti]
MALVRSFQMLFPLAMPKSCMHTLTTGSNFLNMALAKTASATPAGGAWSTLSARTVVRNQFPRARETKRVRVHGWWKRLSTPEGRRTLMRRILKGRHVLSH